MGFIDLPASWQLGQLLASYVISRWIRGHHMSLICSSVLSLPGSPQCKDILIGARRIFGITSLSSTFSKLFSSNDNASKSFAPRAV